MTEIPFANILEYLLLATRWTLLLSIVAFIGGTIGALLLLLLRYSHPKVGVHVMNVYVEIWQGTPLLIQLLLVFFGIPMLGVEVSPLLAASVGLTFYASAFLSEIWRGCVDAIGRGQWDASAALGMKFFTQMRYVILPQALKIALPPTVGFLVQLVKSTAVASIIGFTELVKASGNVANATFQPALVYGLVAIIFFCLCFPLTMFARVLERKLTPVR